MNLEALAIRLVVGAVAGWLAGTLVRGRGYGLVGDVVVGIVGSLIAGWLFPRIHLHLFAGFVGSIVDAAVGAIILLLILRLVRRA
jgi:uncharacterized membrane protein YeaQ/YmgE (transglycosylase-associated protein family)